MRDDRVVYLRGYGVRRAGTQQRVDEHTVFELASVSKPVGAAVIAGAVGLGCVHWTDPVATDLPGFTLSDAETGSTVTIADMYAHRSGLPDHAGDLLEDLGYDRATILQRLAASGTTCTRLITRTFTSEMATLGDRGTSVTRTRNRRQAE